MRIALLLLIASTSASGQVFYPDDPLEKWPAPIRVEDAEFRKLNDYYDLFLHQLGKPGERQAAKAKKGEPIRARTINTLDEVPDSRGWFTNRIGTQSLTPEDIVRAADFKRPPAEGAWTIVAAKTEGVTPGFRIQDSSGEQYFIKFDPLKHAEMATAADIIGSLAFHALGYYVPENYLVSFDPAELEIKKGAMIPDAKGVKRQIERFDVDHALLKVPRNPDGTVRAIASRLLKGKILGEFRFFGTRSDDHNDTIPHEHRRELRGLFVFDAWLNHNDSRAINDLTSLVEEDGLKFVRHYLIDFGAILGSASILSNTARDGNAYFYEPRKALAQAFTLGAYVPRWARAKYLRSPAVGMINWDRFRPDDWRPNYPNPAFDNRLPDDEFWAAKKVMAFRDEHIEAMAKAGRYSNPRDTEWITKYLIERRDRIGETYFAKVLPLDRFRIESGSIAFDDLGIRYGFDQSRDLSYTWSRFDNAAGTYAAIDAPASPSIPGQAKAAAPGSYYALKISGDEPGKSVTVWVRKATDGLELVGVRRDWPAGS